MKTTRCTRCAKEFSDDELEGHYSCPNCGCEGVPCAISEDVVVKINWHELRILGVWATNFAESTLDENQQKDLAAVLKRLEEQFPGKTPLTIRGELQQVADATGCRVEVKASHSREVIKPNKLS